MSLSFPFRPAKHFSRGPRREPPSLIVIHTMEAPEKGSTAENVASYFAGESAPQASAHYCIDNDSIVQCVKDDDIAWHASNANARGIGLEHAGYAKQTREEWADEYSVAMLRLSAKLSAQLCAKYNIPVEFVDEDGLRLGQAGFTGHVNVNKAFNAGSHWDPGPGFPWDLYLEMVREELAAVECVA